MEIKTLENIDMHIIHEAFTEAFYDYEVKITLSFEKFMGMVKTRDLNPAYSAGAFSEGKLVGFVLSGFRNINGKPVCYDGGTGVVKDFREKKLGSSLLENLLPLLREKGVTRYILEVLENNKPARGLYEKYGFKKTRKFCCYAGKFDGNIPDASETGDSVNSLGLSIRFGIENYEDFENHDTDSGLYLSYTPSWQNDRQSVLNIKDKFEYIGLTEKSKNKLIAYCLIHKESGDIPQIGVLSEFRGKNLESAMIKLLLDKIGILKFSMLNIEENDYLNQKLIDMGCNNFVNQYEMEMPL